MGNLSFFQDIYSSLLKILLFSLMPYHDLQGKTGVCFVQRSPSAAPQYAQETMQIPHQCSQVLQNLPLAYDLREASTVFSRRQWASGVGSAKRILHPLSSSKQQCMHLSAVCLNAECVHIRSFRLLLTRLCHPIHVLYLTLRPCPHTPTDCKMWNDLSKDGEFLMCVM